MPTAAVAGASTLKRMVRAAPKSGRSGLAWVESHSKLEKEILLAYEAPTLKTGVTSHRMPTCPP